MSHRFIFIGAGNLATRLSTELKSKGFTIDQVYSRSVKSASELANKLQTNYTNSPKEISSDADIYFVALKDAAFDTVLPQFQFQNKLLVHCSGSMPLSSLKKYSQNIGVFYPLQTFSKKRKVNFSEIPVFIEANSPENEKKLFQIAEKISHQVSALNSEKRLHVHIAAVFACNFVNYFYSEAAQILKTQNISFEVLKPLIMETSRKVQEMNPDDAQTGPAVRFDENVIDKHLTALKYNQHASELYNSISKSIFEFHKKNS